MGEELKTYMAPTLRYNEKTKKIEIEHSDGTFTMYDPSEFITSQDDNSIKLDSFNPPVSIKLDLDGKLTAESPKLSVNSSKSDKVDTTISASSLAAPDYGISTATAKAKSDFYETRAIYEHSALNGINSYPSEINGYLAGGYVYPSKTAILSAGNTWSCYFPTMPKIFWMNKKDNLEIILNRFARVYAKILIDNKKRKVVFFGISKDGRTPSAFSQTIDAREVTLNDVFKRAAEFATQEEYNEVFGPIVDDLSIDFYTDLLEEQGLFYEGLYDIKYLFTTKRLKRKYIRIDDREIEKEEENTSIFSEFFKSQKPFWNIEDEEDEDNAEKPFLIPVENGDNIKKKETPNITSAPYTPSDITTVWPDNLVYTYPTTIVGYEYSNSKSAVADIASCSSRSDDAALSKYIRKYEDSSNIR